jgi:predicted ABC-type ATPase
MASSEGGGMDNAPVVVMVAGPNGAGKSSIAPGLLKRALGVVEYVNADVIARGISGFNSEGAAVAAGRIMLLRLEELAGERESFAFETTGASRSFAARIQSLRQAGYYVLLAYVWVDSPDTSVNRVAKRVALGGHHVPEDTVRRRYSWGLINFFDLYIPLADAWELYDNSSPGNAILVAEGGLDRKPVVHGADQWQMILEMAEMARTEK